MTTSFSKILIIVKKLHDQYEDWSKKSHIWRRILWSGWYGYYPTLFNRWILYRRCRCFHLHMCVLQVSVAAANICDRKSLFSEKKLEPISRMVMPLKFPSNLEQFSMIKKKTVLWGIFNIELRSTKAWKIHKVKKLAYWFL